MTALIPAALSAQPDSPGLQPLGAEARHRINEVFAEYDRAVGPGCSVGVVVNGTLAYARGYGIGQMDHGIALDESSVFYLASVSKQFAAAAVVIAEHEGHLSLNDDVRAHIPGFPPYARGPVTVRHLLHHTSGVRDYLTLLSLAGVPFENILTDEAMMDLVTRQKQLNFEPGAEFLYSNSGYVLLAEIVKRATGRSLGEYAEEKIFGPLGMRRSHFHEDRTRVVKGRVFSYHPRTPPQGAEPATAPSAASAADAAADVAAAPPLAAAPTPEAAWRTDYLINFDKVGDGGMYSTVEDLARWDVAFYGDALGVPGFADRMYERGVLNSGDTIAYARGLAVEERRGLRRVSHAGGLMGFRTMIARYPDERATVIVLCNAGTANPMALSMAVEDIVLEPAFAGEEPVAGSPDAQVGNTPAAGPDEDPAPAASPMSAERLRTLTGAYRSDELDAIWTIEAAAGGRLLLHHPSGESPELEQRGENRMGWSGLDLDFVRDGAGPNSPPTAFVLSAGRVRNVRFDRVPESRP